jgi:hypothetical protein
MSITMVVQVVLTAAGFPLLLWAIGRADQSPPDDS